MNKIMTIGFRLLATILAFLWVLPGYAVANDTKQSINDILQQKGYTSIPITIRNGFLYIDAFINKYPSLAIIDTGSADINITQNAVEKLKLATVRMTKNSNVGMHGEKSFVESVRLSSVTIGNVQLKNITANIFQHVLSGDMPTLVIGSNFLKQHHAIIDIDNEKLYLGQKKLSQSEMAEIQGVLAHQQWQAVPLMFLASGSMVIPVQINQALPVSFLFDTGTGVTLLSQDYVKEWSLQQKGKDTIIEKLIMNPLNLSFQSKIILNNISIQPADLAMLKKYLYVQGILGLAEMMKAHAIIFLEEGIIDFQSGVNLSPRV